MKKILIVTTIIFCTVSAILINFYSIKIYRVASPSMEPKIKKESIIFVKGEVNYKIGDIATYKTLQNPHSITHRILKIFKVGDKYYFEFKGDANENPDPYTIMETEIIGKYFLTIPYMGKAFQLFKHPKILFVLISIPTGLISGKMFKKFINNS